MRDLIRKNLISYGDIKGPYVSSDIQNEV